MQQLRGGKTLVLEPKPEEIEGLSKRFKVETVLHFRVTLTSSGMPGLKNCVKGIQTFSARSSPRSIDFR
jgi:hypothetical protein